MTGKEISEMQTKYVLQGWSKQGGLNPTPVDHCEGIYIYDKDGKRYADMSSEQVNVNAGYANGNCLVVPASILYINEITNIVKSVK